MTALEPVPAAGPPAEPGVRLALRFEAARPVEELLIHVSLFAEQNPLHVDACELSWNGERAATFLFGVDGASWWFRPASARRAGVLAGFFRLGLAHIATGYDHLAFLAGLLLAARRWTSLVGLATAFTAAHSLSLALAVLDVVRLPSRLVELAIAISIAYLGALNLLLRSPSPRWVEASAFGLIHGLGFAAFLREALGGETLVATALFGFNLGVEAGQVVAVLLGAGVAALLPGDRGADGSPRAWLAPRWLRLGGSLCVALSGLGWFAERAGWLP
jgi:hydrogenase/urease accessory protein HupE